jgi:hypothetical protein
MFLYRYKNVNNRLYFRKSYKFNAILQQQKYKLKFLSINILKIYLR